MHKFVLRSLSGMTAVALLALVAAPAAYAADPATDFGQTCASCHTIGGGRLTGPDLKDVSKRRDRAWLVKFITDPNGVLDSGDPYALKLLEEARNVRMPPVAGMSRDRANALLDLIEAESAKPKSRFMGLQMSDRPFTPADVEAGYRLYTGRDGLAGGGAACIGCHTVGGLGALGGGRLGPDLTKVFERYEDRRKLGAWLKAPATQTMLPTFKDHPLEDDEILSLVAWFQDAADTRDEDTSPSTLVFVLVGLGGAIAVILLMNRAWSRRFRAVRKPLLRESRLPEADAVARP